MKKWWIILIILIIIAVVAGIYFLPEDECSIDNLDACDRTCSSHDECEISACQCININEELDVPDGMAYLCETEECSCIEGTCTNVGV